MNTNDTSIAYLCIVNNLFPLVLVRSVCSGGGRSSKELTKKRLVLLTTAVVAAAAVVSVVVVARGEQIVETKQISATGERSKVGRKIRKIS